MEENQTSENVAELPDMSESLTSETEETSNLTTEHEAHPVAVTTNASLPGVTNVQGVPVSVPLGSIIGVNSSNGTTYNVITSDQLQVCFKSYHLYFYYLFIYYFDPSFLPSSKYPILLP